MAAAPSRRGHIDDLHMDPLASQSSLVDELSGDDGLFSDDALTVMQPALSAAATRLTLPKTPAAEKAAALDKVPEGPFFGGVTEDDDSSDGPESPHSPGDMVPPPPDHHSSRMPPPRTIPSRPRPASIQVASESPRISEPPPSPWRSRPDTSAQSKSQQPKKALEYISFGQTRQKRSGSTGADALKRLSRALPSLPNASSFFNSVFSSSPHDKSDSSPGFSRSWTFSSAEHSPPLPSPGRFRGNTSPKVKPAPSPQPPPHRPSQPQPQPQQPPPSALADRVLTPRSSLSGKARSLRRTASDDSLLYHSLSRVSSLGDDDRFENVREMTNVRMKAIRDSLPDRPTFKMPSLPKFSTQLKMFQGPDEQSIPPIPEVPAAGSDGDAASTLDRVLDALTGDLVVLGGYRGSILRSAEAPHQQLWAPVKIGFNMRKADLEVGLDYEDELTMEQRIIPSGMLQNIGPIDISRKFFKKIRSCANARNGKLRIWDYGYDWRLSPHLLSKKMISFLETLPSNQADYRGPKGALVVAHSLGGVITRHVVNQRPDLFSGVVYVGTPQRCINVLGPLRNGDAVLLNEKILTAQVNLSLRTTFAFLPEDGFCFIDKKTNEEYPLDFYDVNDWIRGRLSPCIETALPSLTPKPQGGLGSYLRNRSSSIKRQSLTNMQGRRDDSARRDGLLNPQLDSNRSGSPPKTGPSPFTTGDTQSLPPPPATRARSVAYLKRILPEIKQFRRELAHDAEHARNNRYPPIAIMYGKSTPTVFAARVDGREGIARTDAYDDLVFRPGDGVVLAREAQAPEGYELVKGGRICTERGHLTMLGDMPAIGKALEAVVRGRKKGIGLGRSSAAEKAGQEADA